LAAATMASIRNRVMSPRHNASVQFRSWSGQYRVTVSFWSISFHRKRSKAFTISCGDTGTKKASLVAIRLVTLCIMYRPLVDCTYPSRYLLIGLFYHQYITLSGGGGGGAILTEIERSPKRVNRTASASAASSVGKMFRELDSEYTAHWPGCSFKVGKTWL